VIYHSHRRFDVIREQKFDVIKSESFSIWEKHINWMYVEILNRQKTTQNDLHFGLIFFLTYWLLDLIVNSRFYRVYLKFIESTESLLKKNLLKSQLAKDNHKLIKINKLIREFDIYIYIYNFTLILFFYRELHQLHY